MAAPNKHEVFPGNSEMARRMREFDWSITPLGAIQSWPESLQHSIRLMLNSRYPMFVWWGPELINFYNDAYIPVLGARHPALGKSAPGVWAEIWDVVGLQAEIVMRKGQATWNESILLVMERYGYTEETYFTFSYSPVMDDRGQVGGVFCACTEDTKRILAERRVRTLRALAERTPQAKTAEDACAIAAAAMRDNRYDFPFAFLYLLDENGATARLAGSTTTANLADPGVIELGAANGAWPLAQVANSGESQIVDDIDTRFGSGVKLPDGIWPEPARQAVVMPIAKPGQKSPSGFLIAGISPRLLLDDDYRGFLELTAGHIATAIASARAYEEEQKRIESLAQIDRAKTAFFGNVSHEFRTPLTLILGPTEELLSGALGETNEVQRAHLTTLRHNAFRLQKLVNTLLDYARVEAGRIEASYEPVDIGLLTRDLASTFCSAVHRAGLLYVINCPSIEEPIYVDRDMWEKIVLNLLSNALKFTLQGVIEVSVKSHHERVALTVRDTGVGIPDEELPNLFERFHRVYATRARTQEGSGIGLALVQELVKLHGGSLEVQSATGSGTSFTIFIPKGTAHLPKNRISAPRTLSSTAFGANPYVEEALRWLPENDQIESLSLPVSASTLTDPPRPVSASSERILVADDNSQMRNYLKRLLETYWQVTAVENGAKALNFARAHRPDLVLSDAMMPELDGFALLRKLREDNATSAIPVILLSARAGEESYIEGMNAGADDYIVKPFGARELVARVKALLEVTRVRRESERRVTNILESITDGFQVIDKDWRLTYMNSEANRALAQHGKDPEWAIGKHFWDEIFPEGAESEMATALRRAMTERAQLAIETYFAPWKRWYSNRIYPLPEGGLANYFQDITERKRAEQSLAEAVRQQEALYQFLEQRYRAQSLEELYGAALDAILSVLRCDRASILLRDGSGIMRFVAWRRLSEIYRKAVEGHSPWKPGEPNPQPVCVPNISAANVDESLKTMLTVEGIGALAFIPLVLNGKLAGKFMIYYDEPHAFNDEEVELGLTIARQLALGIEHRQAEAALRESEERYRAVVESQSEMLCRFRSDGTILFVNGAYARALGATPDALVGRSFWEFVPREDQSAVRAMLDGLTPKAPEIRIENRLETADGMRWVLWSNRALKFDVEGRWREAQSAGIDISERKDVEDAKARLAAIVESSDDAIISKDLNGIITSWNNGAERLFGYSAQEAIGQSVSMIIPFERLDEEPGILERIRRGSSIEHYETVRRRKDGTLLDISLTVSPIVDASGRIVGASKVARDVTERKRAEEKLRESEERFRAMADSSPNIIWMTDEAGSARFWNRTYLDYVGIASERMATFDWTAIVHPDDRDGYVAAFETALHKCQTFQGRARLRRYDGEWRWFECRGYPILDSAGRMTGYIGSSLDMTEIYESQQKLKELDQRKDEFLANMSHEIRSPLTGIMGYADILLSKLKDPEDIEFLNTIKESGNYLIEIVNDILDLSKIEAGKLVLNIEAVSVHAVLSELQGLMDGRARQKKLPLVLRYEGVLPESIQTDRTRLRQILINLVSNAIKFTDQGRVEILARFLREGGLLQVEVIDTGIGIAPEHQARLFQPFTQADSTSTREYGGTGLGLTITKRLVEMLGGSISFDSEVDKGSTFRVTIPTGAPPKRVKAVGAKLPVDSALDEFPLRDRHVLVVDDRKEFCYLVSRYIEAAGGRATAVCNGEAALDAVEAAEQGDPFHAVIMDIQMPGIDGYETTRRLRAKGFRTPIIALTAGAMVGDREKCLKAGCDDYLTKPIDRTALVQLLAHHAERLARAKLKILVVDDSHASCKLISGFLEKRGHEVREAYDGESALLLAREFRPDVILLDIRLPDMNGYALMQRLKEINGLGRAKFIGVSGYYDPTSHGSMEFDHFLEKPLDMSRLEAVLRSRSASATPSQ
jgi:PAS domain S-box-containing protein